MRDFLRTFEITPNTRILDVGGTPYNWQWIDCPARITLLNTVIPDPLPDLPQNMAYISGDGTCLQYDDHSFDIVFSNSVIEHLGTLENQVKFAREVRRVGRSLWIQTPNRGFFIEPHFLSPFFHFLPKPIQRRLARNFTLWGWLTRPSDAYVANLVDELRLVDHAELQTLFPDCVVYRETLLGLLTKSLIAIRKG